MFQEPISVFINDFMYSPLFTVLDCVRVYQYVLFLCLVRFVCVFVLLYVHMYSKVTNQVFGA